jgi:hypothetical protein
VIKLHVNNSPVYSLDGRWVAYGTLDPVAGFGGVATVNATQTNLSNDNWVLASRSWCFDISLGRLKDFNVFTDCAQSLAERDAIFLLSEKKERTVSL